MVVIGTVLEWPRQLKSPFFDGTEVVILAMAVGALPSQGITRRVFPKSVLVLANPRPRLFHLTTVKVNARVTRVMIYMQSGSLAL